MPLALLIKPHCCSTRIVSAVRSGGEDELKDFHKNSSWNTWNERNDDDDWMEKSQKLLNDLSKCKYSTKFQQNDVNDDKIEKRSGGKRWKKSASANICLLLLLLVPALQTAFNCEKVDEEKNFFFLFEFSIKHSNNFDVSSLFPLLHLSFLDSTLHFFH